MRLWVIPKPPATAVKASNARLGRDGFVPEMKPQFVTRTVLNTLVQEQDIPVAVVRVAAGNIKRAPVPQDIHGMVVAVDVLLVMNGMALPVLLHATTPLLPNTVPKAAKTQAALPATKET